jgi:hypothetical protein
MALLLIALYGCEEIVDFPESSLGKRIPVIQATLTDQMEPQVVKFSYTTTLSDSLSSRAAENATIYVLSTKGDSVKYNYVGSGVYQSAPYKAEAGTGYTLIVQTDTSIYRASGTLVPMKGIDTVKVQCTPRSESNDSIFSLHFGLGPVIKDQPRYYLTRLMRNKTEITKESTFALITDKYEYSLDDIKIYYAFKVKDTITIEVYSLEKKVYDFYDSLNQLVILNYSSIGYMENPPSMFDHYAMGYFQISAVEKKTVIIR